MEPRMTQLVRKYSHHVGEKMPDNPLSQGLGIVASREEKDDEKKKTQSEEWREWVLKISKQSLNDEHGTPERLHEMSRKVVVAWSQLDQQIRDEKDENHISMFEIPTVAELHATVTKLDEDFQKAKETRRGRIKDGFLGFVNTLNDYSYLFSIIPNNDKYTSLITGVVSSMAKVKCLHHHLPRSSPGSNSTKNGEKASANHQTAGERISTALSSIHGTLRRAQRHIRITNTPETQLRLVEIYVKVFDFLCFAMLWYRSGWKRFQISFNKNFDQKELNPKIKAIEDEWKILLDEVQLVTNDRIDGINSTTQRTAGDVSSVLSTVLLSQEQLKTVIELLYSLGSNSSQHLRATEQHFTHDRQHGAIHLSTAMVEHQQAAEDGLRLDDGHDRAHTATNAMGTLEGLMERLTRQDLIQSSTRLGRFMEDGRDWISKEGNSMTRAALPEEVVIEMERWLKSATKILWVEGPPSTAFGPTLSFASMYICGAVQKAGIPCVSYFCKDWYDFRRTAPTSGKLTSAEAALVSMIYSIISQTVTHLAADFHGTADLKERFKQLDGSLPSLVPALDLIQDLVPHLPLATIWILDGIQVTDAHTTTISYVQKLITILRSEASQKVVKVLFTTNGNCFTLMKNTRVSERVDANRLAQDRGEGRLAGGLYFY